MPSLGKLVRDKIPQKIRARGDIAIVRNLNNIELLDVLRHKLVEEATELAAVGNRGEASVRRRIKEELADVKEVYDRLLQAYHILPQEVARMQRKRRDDAGGYEQAVYLEDIIIG